MHKKPGPPKPIGPKVINLRATTSKNHSNNTTLPPSNNTPHPKKNKKKRNRVRILLFIFLALLFAIGIYILFILIYPYLSKPNEKTIRQEAEQVETGTNKIFIPSVGVKSIIKGGGIEVLDQGVVWHRFIDRGNPEKGGNFILTGHSFVWGYTPQDVIKQSVFYHLSDAKEGEEIIIHWSGKKYTYKITEKKTVKPNAVEIENPSEKPKLTIYTCTTGGANDGRIVLIAEPNS